MASRKRKYYVVWQGHAPGVYASWAECERAIRGYSQAKYRAFPTAEAAKLALAEGPDAYWGTGKFVSPLSAAELAAIGQPIPESLCVDAAWNAETKVMEYRGVWLHDRSLAFSQGPFAQATNNLGEFLAIVHALAMLSKDANSAPVYSDSRVAINWVLDREVRSRNMAKGETGERVNNLVRRALDWLAANTYPNKILKWETQAWGEVPADYGRK
jgi:ribonuclease HI